MKTIDVLRKVLAACEAFQDQAGNMPATTGEFTELQACVPLVLEAIAREEAQTVEPVMWMWASGNEQSGSTTDRHELHQLSRDYQDIEITPLFTHPAPSKPSGEREPEPVSSSLRPSRTDQEFKFGMDVLTWNRAQQSPPIDVGRELWVADEVAKLIKPLDADALKVQPLVRPRNLADQAEWLADKIMGNDYIQEAAMLLRKMAPIVRVIQGTPSIEPKFVIGEHQVHNLLDALASTNKLPYESWMRAHGDPCEEMLRKAIIRIRKHQE